MSRRIIPFLFTAGLLACSSSAATHPAADAVAAQDAADVLTAQDVVAAPDETADVKIWPATVTSSDAVDVFYSQGIARVPDGWIFSASGGLWRTDDKFVQTVENMVPLPDAVTALGYNHIGDIDVAQGVLYASVEQDDFNKGEQAVVLFDPQTLQYKSHVILKQHEASFIAVDETTMTAYLTDHYSDDKILSYDVKDGWKPLPVLQMSQQAVHIQGADVADGALWLSCDDDGQSIYRVDLKTGAVVQVGTVNRQEKVGNFRPEVEGIDATPLPSGLLHVLTGEPLKATSWVDHFAVK